MFLSYFIGETIIKIEGLECGSFDVTFYCSDGSIFKMYPYDDTFLYGNYCECSISDICGNVEDLIGNEILIADERDNRTLDEFSNELVWTFYTFATIKGYLDIRWYGEHNGYYSADVDFW